MLGGAELFETSSISMEESLKYSLDIGIMLGETNFPYCVVPENTHTLQKGLEFPGSRGGVSKMKHMD